jgi:hypothetical protein
MGMGSPSPEVGTIQIRVSPLFDGEEGVLTV